MSRRVFVDTSAFYAIISGGDEFHERASKSYEYLIDRKAELYTSSYVLVETMALVHRRLGLPQLKTFVESIDGIVKTYWVNAFVHHEAWKTMVARRDSRLSFVDWTTVVIAKRLNASLFGFDEDMAQEGLATIP